VGGNEPFYVHSPNDRSALDLPAGSTATSPPLCFGVAYPRLRFFAVSTSDAPATIRVRVVSWSLLGGLKILDAGSVTAGTSWAPPSYMCLGSALASVVGTKVMQIQLVPSAGVRIDDVYVDPLLQEV
jgi:hypothetical protein